MAHVSSLVSKAQVPVMCDLCESVADVDWYCADCEETLCVTCQVSHSRSKASRDHVIIPRSDALKYKTENSSSNDDIFCETHGGGKFELHCDTCDVMVCRKCVTGDHKGHNFTDILDVAKIKKETFNTEVEKILNNFIPKIDNDLQVISNRKEAHSGHNNSLQKRLRKQRDDVITAINEWFDMLIKQIEENSDKIIKPLDAHEKHLTKRKDALLLTIDEWKNEVQNSSPKAVLQYLKKVQSTLRQTDTISELDPMTTSMLYIPGEINIDTLRGMLGAVSLSIVRSKPKSPKIILTLGCEFGVERIVAISPWLAYASNTSKTHLAVVDAEKMSAKGIIEFDFKVGAFDVSFQREIYICVRDEKCVKKYGKDLSTSLFISTSPYTPRSVCITDAGDVVVGTQSSSASSQLLRYSDQGRLKDKIEGFFKAPDYICENGNGDLCVSDSGVAKVLVFNAKLEKRFIYTGYSKRFAPRGIACNAQGYIFICDCVNDQVEVIDVNGKFIQLFLTKENDVSGPRDLSIDKEGHVWIGQRGKDEPNSKQKEIKRIIVAKFTD